MAKKTFSIDPNVKGAMSEIFDKLQMSEIIDVPAGCKSRVHYWTHFDLIVHYIKKSVKATDYNVKQSFK